jgi:hypothetical protein
MKPVTRFLILAFNSALVACASQAPTSSAPPPSANVDASQALASAPAGAATPAATAAAQSQQPFTIPYGYRHKVVSGQDEYCRTDASTGSRTEKVEVCYSRAELEAMKAGNDTQTQQAHENAGAKVYSAPTQQQGPTTPN